jgi:hypothetical protein
MKLAYLIFFLLFSSSAFAQQAVVKINMNPKVEEILNKKTALDKEKPVIAGYRLQLYFGGNRNEAAEIKARFASLYADYNAYLIYQQPYFKLRVGDFRNRITAGNFQKIILKDFPAVFIVKDDIAFPK